MLLRELIVRHLGPQGAVHARGTLLDEAQAPPGTHIHQDQVGDGDDAVSPAAGDLVLVRAPVGPGMREHIVTDLPVGVSVVVLLEVEVADLPVGRLLAALAAAKLQVVEAAVVSGIPAPTVAVVATRTDELITPGPNLTDELEPGDHEGPAVLRRVIGEHALEGLVQRFRERALLARIAEIEAVLPGMNAELEQLRAVRQAHHALVAAHKATVGDLEAARRQADTARTEADTARKEADTARKEADKELKQMLSLRSSTSFKVASRMARVASIPRRMVRRARRGKARG